MYYDETDGFGTIMETYTKAKVKYEILTYNYCKGYTNLLKHKHTYTAVYIAYSQSQVEEKPKNPAPRYLL